MKTFETEHRILGLRRRSADLRSTASETEGKTEVDRSKRCVWSRIEVGARGTSKVLYGLRKCINVQNTENGTLGRIRSTVSK